MSKKLSAESKNSLGMPLAGFGCYQLSEEQAESAVCEALKAGFRHIDSAEAYQNETGVGKGIKASGVPREEIFITTKVMPGYAAWNMPEKGYDETIAACKKSLEQLQIDYCDLYLIHAPLASTRVDIWKACVELKRQGLAKHIGVSNYLPEHFAEIKEAGLEQPEANQIEMHPLCQQKELSKFMTQSGIVPIAYSSLATMSSWRAEADQGGDKTASLKEECQKVQKEVSDRIGKPEAAMLLRWGLQMGYAVLTKSVNPERIKANLDIFTFEIPESDMAALAVCDKQTPVAWTAAGFDGGVQNVSVAVTAKAAE